jgi:hypothetical protein
LNVTNKFSARVMYRTPAKLSTSLETRRDSEYYAALKYWNIIKLHNKLTIFWRSCDRVWWRITYNKPASCTNSSNLFWKKILHVSDSSFVHHQEFFTVHTAMLYVIYFCWQLASRIRMFHPDPASKLFVNLYDIYHCCV